MGFGEPPTTCQRGGALTLRGKGHVASVGGVQGVFQVRWLTCFGTLMNAEIGDFYRSTRVVIHGCPPPRINGDVGDIHVPAAVFRLPTSTPFSMRTILLMADLGTTKEIERFPREILVLPDVHG